MDGVLFALLSSGVVVIAVASVWHLHVRFLDVTEYLLVDPFFKGLPRLHESVRVSVFSLEISDHGGICFFAKPKVIIHQPFAMNNLHLRNLLRHGRLRMTRGMRALAIRTRATLQH